MDNWKERLVEEQTELTDKLCKLVAFLGSDDAVALPDNHIGALLNQAEVMLQYQRILLIRLRELEPKHG